MSDLVSLLLAAIEAREQKARKAQGTTWDVARDGEVRELGNGGTVAYVPRPEDAEFIAGNDPAAVLRRCAEERKVVLAYKGVDMAAGEFGPVDLHPVDRGKWIGLRIAVNAIAAWCGISVEEETTGE